MQVRRKSMVEACMSTFGLYGSGSGSTQVSSMVAYRSTSVKRLMAKVCFASNG